MTKLYLITGFLGAGKTTFLQKFVKLFPDQKIALIINEFGKAGVDGTLLQNLDVAMTEIDNGSIFCACRVEQFEDAVLTILEKNKPDLIFVEASGLADPSAVKGIFSRPIYREMTYAGAICLVDGARFHKVYQSARVSRMQLAISDLVLINKTDIAERELVEEIISIAKAQKPARPVYETVYGEFDPLWLKDIEDLKQLNEENPQIHTRDITLRSLTLEVRGFTVNHMRAFLQMFAEDTYRIKGFAELEHQMYVIDCVGPIVELRPFSGEVAEPGRLTVLFGNKLNPKKGIQEAVSWFPDCEVSVIPT